MSLHQVKEINDSGTLRFGRIGNRDRAVCFV